MFAQKRIANSRPKPVTREMPISGRAPRRGRKSGCTWRASTRLHFAPRALRVVVSVPHYSVNSAHAVRPAARLSSAFFEVCEKCFCARYGIRISIRTIARSIFALSLAFCAESQRQADPGKNTKNRAKEPTSSKIGVAPTSGPRAARFLRAPGQSNRGLATLIPSLQNVVTDRLSKPAPPQGDQKSVKRSVWIRERIVSCCRVKHWKNQSF